ncbi:putative late blight resistance protein-like protein R1A-6 [Forsythia ovata]|uniref:Late blight resistance protein-like protein R1A-6 n=1 Tax=Forsythia ovata TaxID=205694 RepID=A0ABD1TBC9_9LAMI
MAIIDTGVEFLFANLWKVIQYNANLILGVTDEVIKLYGELNLLSALLKDYADRGINNYTLQVLVKQIRDVVYRAEDAVETYVTLVAMHKSKGKTKRYVGSGKYLTDLRSVAEKINSIIIDVKEMYTKGKIDFTAAFQNLATSQGSGEEKTAFHVEENNVVGFQDETTKIIEHLNGGSEELQVISIIGMPGLGKTTLAKKIFSEIKQKFNHQALVSVSQNPSKKEVFLDILGQITITKLSNEIRELDEKNLVKNICELLKEEKYLILIDDIWEKKVWDDLKIAFPNNKKQSRILLTSRIFNVSKHANPTADPHHLRLLDDKESWDLLKHKALPSMECPVELKTIGESIAKKCDGLPLAVDITGGILHDRGTDQKTGWENIDNDLHTYIFNDSEQRLNKSMAMSFNHLSPHLRTCFVYFGMFPKYFKIPASKLVRLWIAEGLVHQSGKVNLESNAQEYLDDLVKMNLVMVSERKFNGKIKTCHVHSKLHEFCKRKAQEEFLFQEFNEPGLHGHLTTCRLLGTHFDISNTRSFDEFGSLVRSFLCYFALPSELVSSIPKAFKLLRVLDAQIIHFTKFPTELTGLIHLTYLDISIDFDTLPATISNLLNMQTLIVKTSSQTLKVQANVWKMIQLRHFETNVPTYLPDPVSFKRRKKNSPINRTLQTLCSIAPESCTEHVFAATPNLKKLVIRGELARLVEVNGGSSVLGSLLNLGNLENLKLVNDVQPEPPSQGYLDNLTKKSKQKKQSPSEGKLAELAQMLRGKIEQKKLEQKEQKLKKLTLSNTQFDWNHVSTFGMLESLEILKLKDNALKGVIWKPEAGCFQALKVLHIVKTDLVYWQASSNHFPNLKCLYLKDCSKLEFVPPGLADIESFQILDLLSPTESVVASARDIQQKKKQKSGFRLSIDGSEQEP